MTLRVPSFLIVGTPRSGTTLVQRLACELPKVATPPETHFFGFFALELLRRRRFPLAGADLRAELAAYADMPKSRDLHLDVPAVYEALGGRADRLADVFAAVVHHLTGEGKIVGEKSPEHLLWWRPIARGLTDMRFVMVVRDPRAVVASATAVWGERGGGVAERAERWSADQREVLRAREALGPRRVLVLRYEDVVEDETAARSALAQLLRVEAPEFVGTSTASAAAIVLPREWWKQRTFEPVSRDRVDAWRQQLSADEAGLVARICADGMEAFGYGETPHAVARRRPGFRARRLRFRAARARHLWRINRATV